MIDSGALEEALVSLINDARSSDNSPTLVRVSVLDEPARTQSSLMAEREQLYAEAVDLRCGTSATQVVQWPQVKSFNYRGPKDSPSSTTPTEYDRSADETAADVVEYMRESESPFISDPHFAYVGVGAAQKLDDLGFMDFWITVLLADCLDDSPTQSATQTAPAGPSPTPMAMAIPSPTPTATVVPAPTATLSVLRGFQNGRWLEQQAPALAASINELDWVRDGVEGTESEVLEDLLFIAVRSRPVASSVIALGWLQDGVDDVEAAAIGWLNNIRGDDVGSLVVSLGWIRDGVHEIEVDAIEQLSYLANRDAEEAIRVVNMPFLQAIGPQDISAITSLNHLAAFRPDMFARVMTHPTVWDGISDDWAVIVATLNGVAKTNPGLIDVLLDSSRVTLEHRPIKLPLAGEVDLFIIRTGPGAARSMDLLEQSVRGAEEFMGAPLPTNFVAVLYEEAVPDYADGTNFGSHISLLPKFDVDDDSREAERASTTNAHEVAHYYWSGNEDWVDEGAAELMALVVEGARTAQVLAVTRPPCAYASSLRDLENLGVSRGDIEFGCNYSLGERIFVDLLRTLGPERFQQGFRDLYLASEVEDDDDMVPGTPVGVGYVREAFRSDDGSENAVISRWYDGTEPYDLSHLDVDPVDPSLPSINGRIDEAYVVTVQDGPAVTTFSAQDVSDWVLLTLNYTFNVSGEPVEVPIEIVEYYEDGSEFRRRGTEFTAKDGYIGGTSRHSVGQSPPRKWAPGRYWVYVYSDGRKIAEVSYEVTP